MRVIFNLKSIYANYLIITLLKNFILGNLMRFYLILFTVFYFLSVFITSIINIFINIPDAINIALLFVVSTTIASIFIKKEKRLPTTGEKQQLVWGSIFGTTFIQLLYLAFILCYEDFNISYTIHQVPVWIWLLILFIVFGIEYFIFYMSYACCSKFFLKK